MTESKGEENGRRKDSKSCLVWEVSSEDRILRCAMRFGMKSREKEDLANRKTKLRSSRQRKTRSPKGQAHSRQEKKIPEAIERVLPNSKSAQQQARGNRKSSSTTTPTTDKQAATASAHGLSSSSKPALQHKREAAAEVASRDL
jgi:Zn-dependent M16 (insulinase) family peptidase